MKLESLSQMPGKEAGKVQIGKKQFQSRNSPSPGQASPYDFENETSQKYSNK